MSEWKKVAFSELFSEPTRNGIYKSKEFHGHGTKIVNMGELFAYDFIRNQDMQRVQLTDTEKKVSLLMFGDLLFARRSLVESGAGKISIVGSHSEDLTFESSVIRVRLNPQICNPLFYLYWFRSNAGKGAIGSLVTGTNVKGIRASELSKVYVDLPGRYEQDKIANILFAYDDLIENNRKQIRLLEEAAQRLYKEWFVDLRFPGWEDAKIVDGVPEGWYITTIDQICDTIGGGTPSTSISEYYENGDIKWVTPSDLTKNGSIILLDTEKKITEQGLKNSSAKMVPPNTILMTSRASIGYFALCEEAVCTNQGFISCIPYNWDNLYYLLWNLKSRVDDIKAKATGSTFLEIAKRTFRSMDIIMPDGQTVCRYNAIAHPIVEQIRLIEKQNSCLVEARNRLLPKLMSGQIAV